ncbi:MurR/RpiR family transcriptional regulator [Amycolatopsis thermoflava]|uniref:MurR/RpiR family transcriptional regulator n=1 Tax=Amycolatopsis thermoflava TaxID=84480 RepID=UPI003663D09B
MTGGIDEASRVPGSVAERARAALRSLPPSEARAAQVLLARGSDVVRMSVSEIAAAAGTGVGTVVRACQSLGFKGFQDAKIALAQDLAPLVGDRSPEHIDRGDSPAEVLAKLAASSADALQRARSSVDAAALERAVGLLTAATRVLVLGVGTSAPLAQDAAYRLLTLGIAAEAPADVHVQHVRAGLLRPGDVVVAVSHTGATRETVSAARRAKESGAAVVAVTSFATTPLTEVADAALVAGGLETRYRVEAMTSRLAHLVVLDALFVSLLLAEPGRSAEAQALVADVLSEHRY